MTTRRGTGNPIIERGMRWLKARAGVFPTKLTNCEIDSTCTFSHAEKLVLGNWVFIGPRSFLAADGGIVIGDGTVLSSWVRIFSSNHDYLSHTSVPYGVPNVFKPVTIGKAVWVGYGAIILPGVSLGDGCVVGAGAVVTRSVDEGTVVGGNPAKLIQRRPDDKWRELIKAERYYARLKWSGELPLSAG